MRKKYLLSVILLGTVVNGQTFIDNSQGIIIPRLTGNTLQVSETKGVYSDAKDAILVYVSIPPDPDKRTGQVEGIDSKGFYYFDASSNRWIRIISMGNSNAVLTQLLCSSSTNIGVLEVARPASGVSVIVPYNGGNGGAYSVLNIPSTGVTGLNAALNPGNLSIGGGFLVFNISGTPLTTGTAVFDINLAGKACSFSFQVRPKTRFDDVLNVSINDQLRQMMTRNLGANPTLDPDMPSQAIMGDYFQWGKKNAVATAYTPAAAISGWSTEKAADKAWNSGTESAPFKTINDPCPSGFRVPTRNEWTAFRQASTVSNIGTWATTKNDGASNFGAAKRFINNRNLITLPAAGRHNAGTGALDSRGYGASYWSSTEFSATNSYNLTFTEGATIYPGYDFNRAVGMSVRCISE
ncbi:hypothetical protein OWR28_14535 [Chryseobacterium sp. 1B4]